MKKTAVLCLVLLFALGLVGPGYARWADAVAVKRQAGSGVLELGIRVSGGGCRGGGVLGPGQVEGCNGPLKFYLGGVPYAESVYLSVYGAPYVAPFFAVEIANGGTVPARVDNFFLDLQGGPAFDTCVGKWVLTRPGGEEERGTGLASLRQALERFPVDPQEKMQLQVQLLFGRAGPAAGSVSLSGVQWNGPGWRFWGF
jgi:hypothetical protein